jgi:hypothetical protein
MLTSLIWQSGNINPDNGENFRPIKWVGEIKYKIN